MAVFRRIIALAFVCLASLSAAQFMDEGAVARVLGPRWRQLSRSAGMVFSGTVLGLEAQPPGQDRPIPLILIKFRVDRAIVGVQPGQVLTVREWAGTWSSHPAMRPGQRSLIFLYPLSRLGLTSPVGGTLGQIVLDPRGEIAEANDPRKDLFTSPKLTSAAEAGGDSAAFAARLKSCPPQTQSNRDVLAVVGVLGRALPRCAPLNPTLTASGAPAARPITLDQLERAIRNARENSSVAPTSTKE